MAKGCRVYLGDNEKILKLIVAINAQLCVCQKLAIELCI